MLLIPSGIAIAVCIALGLLLLRPVLTILIYCSMLFAVPYNKDNRSLMKKIIAYPSIMLNRVVPESNRYALYHVSLIPWMSVRKFLYRMLGARIDSKVQMHFKTEIRGINKLAIGRGSIVGDNALLDARNGLTLGKNVNISSNVSIYSMQHDYRDEWFRCNQPGKQSIEIADRVWIGCNVVVLPGVTIGEGAVCCAGCVVTKDVEPWSVVAGIPAKKIGNRPAEQQYEFSSKILALI